MSKDNHKVANIALAVFCCFVVGVAVIVLLNMLDIFPSGDTTSASYKIVSAEHTVKQYTEVTIFTIEISDDGDLYTLPVVNTKYVRKYHEGDYLPVLVSDNSGSPEYKVDIRTLREALRGTSSENN